MKLAKENKIEKALSKDANARHQTEHAMLDGTDLVATNGRILVVVPVKTDDDDTDGLVSKKAIVEARKGIPTGGVTKIGCNAGLHLEAQGMTLERPFQESTGSFPDWKQVVPEEESTVRKVTLSASLLRNLAEAMAADAVTLHLQADKDDNGNLIHRAILVSSRESEAYGVIMPIAPKPETPK